MKRHFAAAAPCYVRYIVSGERHNVVAWIADDEGDLGAVIVRDGALETLWMSQQHFYDNVAFHDGRHVPGDPS